MRTLHSVTTAQGLKRDLLLLGRMAAMFWQYWTFGGRLRRAYRRREARGEVYFVDEAGPTAHREESLRSR